DQEMSAAAADPSGEVAYAAPVGQVLATGAAGCEYFGSSETHAPSSNEKAATTAGLSMRAHSFGDRWERRILHGLAREHSTNHHEEQRHENDRQRGCGDRAADHACTDRDATVRACAR